MNIHENGNSLVPSDRERIDANAETQEKRIKEILQQRPDHQFGYFEIIDRTGYDKDSAKRSLSNLSGSAPHDRYKDEYGNWPVVYHRDRRKRNPSSGASVGTYRWNPLYGVRSAEDPIPADEFGQVSAFPDPVSRHSGPYSGVGS